MGYNDNSGDFFIDSTLTDRGRQQIARNDGSFVPSRLRFGDDEIDYRNWNELTGSDSKDAKILDTPILEPFSNEVIALKSPLVTIRNPTVQYMPVMVANPTSISLKDRTDATGGGVSITVAQQVTKSQVIVPPELVDVNYLVKLDNDLLYVANQYPVSITTFGSALYIVPADNNVTSASGGSQCTFVVRVQTLNTTLFDTLVGASVARPRTITANVTVQGQQSGLYVTVPVSILEFV